METTTVYDSVYTFLSVTTIFAAALLHNVKFHPPLLSSARNDKIAFVSRRTHVVILMELVFMIAIGFLLPPYSRTAALWRPVEQILMQWPWLVDTILKWWIAGAKQKQLIRNDDNTNKNSNHHDNFSVVLKTLKQGGPLGTSCHKVVEVLAALMVWLVIHQELPSTIQVNLLGSSGCLTPVTMFGVLLLSVLVNAVLWAWAGWKARNRKLGSVSSSSNNNNNSNKNEKQRNKEIDDDLDSNPVYRHRGVRAIRSSSHETTTTTTKSSFSVSTLKNKSSTLLWFLQDQFRLATWAFVNALCEELTSRGFWRAEFQRAAADAGISSNNHQQLVSNLAQAAIFGWWHYYGGIPNGVVGVVLTFVYGLLMGALADYVCGGDLTLSILAHTIADYFIFAHWAAAAAANKTTTTTRKPKQKRQEEYESLATEETESLLKRE